MCPLQNTALYFAKYAVVCKICFGIFKRQCTCCLQYNRVLFITFCGIFRRLWHYISQTMAILKIEIWQWQSLRSNYGFLNVEVWQGRV